jgi:hypothetical protein
LSDILCIEAEGRAKMPKKFSGLRPHEKAELLRRQREDTSEPNIPQLKPNSARFPNE